MAICKLLGLRCGRIGRTLNPTIISMCYVDLRVPSRRPDGTARIGSIAVQN
jgi:hypothetical protein